MTSKITYKGSLRTQATHLKSGIGIITDAPIDNHGKGEAFSPTDLLATSLGSCMLTVMAIAADRLAVNMEGTEVEITKIMSAEPRKVSGINVKITFPKNSVNDPKSRKILENSAHTCPVAKSLHPDLKQDVEFVYL